MTNQINPTSTSTNAMPAMIRIAKKRPSIGPANVEALSGSHQRMRRSSVSSLGGEAEIRRLRLAPRPRPRRRLRAVLLVPGLDRARPPRQPLDGERAAAPAHAEEGMRHHAQPPVHP